MTRLFVTRLKNHVAVSLPSFLLLLIPYAFADDCDSICASISDSVSSTSQLQPYCLERAADQQSYIMDAVMLALDGAVLIACTTALAMTIYADAQLQAAAAESMTLEGQLSALESSVSAAIGAAPAAGGPLGGALRS